MFTGIIEATGIVQEIRTEGSNRRISIEAPFANELKPDQSVAHNGVCLTVEKITGKAYEVVAIEETLHRSNLGRFKEKDIVNL
jgi:riboflavin synthase